METCKSGSEGVSVKPDVEMHEGARLLPYNGNRVSYGARTVKFWPFTHQNPRWIAPAYRSAKRIMGTEKLTNGSHRWSRR